MADGRCRVVMRFPLCSGSDFGGWKELVGTVYVKKEEEGGDGRQIAFAIVHPVDRCLVVGLCKRVTLLSESL